ncbi:MAG: hypothetical protein U1E87_07780 [Alphaproteobacteria bacterium]
MLYRVEKDEVVISAFVHGSEFFGRTTGRSRKRRAVAMNFTFERVGILIPALLLADSAHKIKNRTFELVGANQFSSASLNRQ